MLEAATAAKALEAENNGGSALALFFAVETEPAFSPLSCFVVLVRPPGLSFFLDEVILAGHFALIFLLINTYSYSRPA